MQKCENILKVVFTCENKEYNMISSAFTLVFSQPTSDFQTYQRSKSQNVGIHLLNWIVMDLLVIQLSRYAEFYTFFTPAPMWFKIWKTTLFYITHRHS